MRVEAHHSEVELKEMVRAETRGRVRDRLRAVALARAGHGGPEIASLLGASLRSVFGWVRRYNAEGSAGLEDRPKSGRRPTLGNKHTETLRERLDRGARPEDAVCTLRGSDVQHILAAEFGAVYTLDGTYKLLHRLGYSSLVPRPRHPKAEAEQQVEFKKSSAPPASVSKRHIRASASSVSGRTRLASASKAR